jgi:hypothetical protein
MSTFNEIFETLNSKALPVQGRKCLVMFQERMLIGRMMDTRYFDIDGDYQSEDSPESRNWNRDDRKTGVFLCVPKLDYSFGGNYFSLDEFPEGMSVYFKTAENAEFRNVLKLLEEYTHDNDVESAD